MRPGRHRYAEELLVALAVEGSVDMSTGTIDVSGTPFADALTV